MKVFCLHHYWFSLYNVFFLLLGWCRSNYMYNSKLVSCLSYQIPPSGDSWTKCSWVLNSFLFNSSDSRICSFHINQFHIDILQLFQLHVLTLTFTVRKHLFSPFKKSSVSGLCIRQRELDLKLILDGGLYAFCDKLDLIWAFKVYLVSQDS